MKVNFDSIGLMYVTNPANGNAFMIVLITEDPDDKHAARWYVYQRTEETFQQVFREGGYKHRSSAVSEVENHINLTNIPDEFEDFLHAQKGSKQHDQLPKSHILSKWSGEVGSAWRDGLRHGKKGYGV